MGVKEETVLQQVKQFTEGFPAVKLLSAATIGQGILSIQDEERTSFQKCYEEADVVVEKFVPASGAATRMFRELLALKNEGVETGRTREFISRISEFPFEVSGEAQAILSTLFDDWGFDRLPKGLLPFHKYEAEIRTPAYEHLVEAVGYAKKASVLKVHFTVSPEHLKPFQDHLAEVAESFSEKFEITYSIQKPETDTVAVTPENVPFRQANGELLYRPAGHGALLENLNERNADILFLKNIDNVIPDRLKPETIENKKLLAGVLLSFQKRIFDLLDKAEAGIDVSVEGKMLLEEVGIKGKISSEQILEKLNRPIRVCGMVKNQGEPGGGPFWVESNGFPTLQIIESAQVDRENPGQLEIFEKSTHFNPVDIVCGVRDFRGEKFDLLKYRDPNTGFITNKSFQGQPIKAMELPGLWNGGMADWNTIFVEVPIVTFNPVKTVNDLLRPEHQA